MYCNYLYVRMYLFILRFCPYLQYGVNANQKLSQEVCRSDSESSGTFFNSTRKFQALGTHNQFFLFAMLTIFMSLPFTAMGQKGIEVPVSREENK